MASSKKGSFKKGSSKKGKKPTQASAPKGGKGASALPKSLRKGDLPRALGDVWAAGVGALSQARADGAQAFEALVARGETVARQGSDAARAAVRDVEAAAGRYVDQARSTADGAAEGVQGRLEDAVEAVLASLGVPRRDEVADLQRLVDDLERRIDALTADAAPGVTAARSAYEVAPHPDGWAVRRAGAARALSVSRTKKDALRDGRAEARAHAPSTLTIRTLDGAVGDVVTYDG